MSKVVVASPFPSLPPGVFTTVYVGREVYITPGEDYIYPLLSLLPSILHKVGVGEELMYSLILVKAIPLHFCELL